MFIHQNIAAVLTCIASIYGTEHHQLVTANGEKYTGKQMTCAMRTTPRNEHYRVDYHGRSANCRHNDWGPALWTHKCIDLSKAMGASLHMPGVGKVNVTRVK